MPPKGSKLATRQRRVVREAVARFTAPFTAQELCSALAASRSDVSRATVYRILSALCAEGRIREVALPDGRRVCAPSSGDGAICVIECLDCGRLSSCAAAGLDACLATAARRRNLRPLQAAVYLKARCGESRCRHLRVD